MYAMASCSHEFIAEEIFEKSILAHEPKINYSIEKIEQLCESGNYYEAGWKEAMDLKIDLYNQAINENDDFFIWSDVDIEFHQPFMEDLLNAINSSDFDILFQKGYGPFGEPEYCAGFFICRINKNTKDFFKYIYNNREQYPCDQEAINKNIDKIKAGFLSEKYFNISKQYRNWNNQNIELPDNIIMCHANYTIGTENKIKMLLKIKNQIKNSKTNINTNTTKEKIQVINAVYGLFEDITEMVSSIEQKTLFDAEKIGVNIIPAHKKSLYIFDQNYQLLNKPIADKTWLIPND
jgi:hypothetical protein